LSAFQKIRGFFKTFKEKLRLLPVLCGELEAFDCKCEAFIRSTRLFEDIFREMEDSIRNLRLVRRLRGCLKTFLIELTFFKVM
jgi:hypothetical protein